MNTSGQQQLLADVDVKQKSENRLETDLKASLVTIYHLVVDLKDKVTLLHQYIILRG